MICDSCSVFRTRKYWTKEQWELGCSHSLRFNACNLCSRDYKQRSASGIRSSFASLSLVVTISKKSCSFGC